LPGKKNPRPYEEWGEKAGNKLVGWAHKKFEERRNKLLGIPRG